MSEYTLTILDTMAIQSYIFGSNRLRENIGASELVKQATEDWAYETLPEPNNVATDGLFNDKTIEQDNLQAEVVYAGGGNMLIIFASLCQARAFVTRLSHRLIEEAPGLELAVVHHPFDWKKKALGGENSGVVYEAFQKLERAKRSQAGNRPLAGLGVTAACQSTGLAAITTTAAENLRASTEEPSRLISAEIEARLRKTNDANQQQFDKYFRGSTFEMARDFDELGRSRGESSYIAVVHADGNNMGERIETIAKMFGTPSDNRHYINKIREFSRQVVEATEASVQAMVVLLLELLDPVQGTLKDTVPIRDRQLPFRLLVVGGDDVTFVCDGRLGLSLAAFYLQTFEEQAARVGLEDVHACAGIGVVKSHYPFARAYQMAEVLCKNAKERAREEDGDRSALDWHFAISGLMGDLEFIRQREYKTAEGWLLMRPITLRPDNDWRNWPTLRALILEFKEEWAGRRNKIKKLREALRAGRTAVEQFVVAYESKLPEPDEFSSRPDLKRTGWNEERCGYFDAIEAMDFFLPLERSQP